jgi:RecA/RadA recombinase
MAKKSKKAAKSDKDDAKLKAKQAKAEAAQAAEAAEPKAKRGKKSKGDDDGPQIDFSAIYTSNLDEISRRQGFEADVLEDVPPMSTGWLTLDIIMGGGIRPAWYTSYGPEQSAKTTGVLNIMAAAIKAGVPIIDLSDYEGSTKNSRPYVAQILKTNGLKVTVKDVFGRKDPETGKWAVKPLVRYRSATVGEKFFDYLSEVLRDLPDKKFIAGKWWLIFDETKVNKAKYGEYGNKSMAKKYGKGIWIPAPDGNLQGLFLVDSYPGMNPSANDDEDANNSIALQARMFSKHIPRVKGRLAQKMVAVIGINQLRSNPMGYPPEIEPCGQALKFNSDARLRWYPRALSGVSFGSPKPHPDNKAWEAEKSVEGEGSDTYRYVHVSATKNKMWNPGREGWFRIWVTDANGVARGFDPFYDTLYYLRQTGQLKAKNRGNITLKIEGMGESKKTYTWLQIKRWVLGAKDDMVKMSEHGGYKPMDLRKLCFKQMENGTAERLYVALKGEGKKGEEDDDDE